MNRIRRVSRRTLLTNQWLALHEDVTDRQGNPGRYFVVDRPNAVIIVAVDDRSELFFLNQFRYPTGEISLEFPMGGVDGHESPLEAAKRELAEETGIVMQEFKECGSFRPVPGLSPQVATVLLCRYGGRFSDVKKEISTSEGEDILGFRIVPVSDVSTLVRTGRITDGFTLSAITLLRVTQKIKGF